MKVFTTYCIILILFATLLSCDSEQRTATDLSDFVPENANLVFKSNTFKTFRSDVSNNTLLANFKDADLFALLNSKKTLLPYLNSSSPTVLSIRKRNDSVLDYTFATKLDSTVFQIDSLPNKSIETLSYKDVSLQRISLGESNGFTAIRDSVFIASSSQTLLQELLTSKRSASKNFKKAFSALKNNELTTILQHPTYRFPSGEKHKLGTYASIDVTIDPNGITASGVALVRDTLPQLLAVFKGQIPQQNDLEAVLPTSATGAVSITISDAAQFFENLGTYRKERIQDPSLALFGSVNEIGEIHLPGGNAVVLKSIDPELTQEALAVYLSESDTFKDTQLYSFTNGALFKNHFAPFCTTENTKVHFQLDSFFVFTENSSVAETIISTYKNNTSLAKNVSFEQSSNAISNASSFLSYGMNANTSQPLYNLFQADRMEVFPSKPLNGYPLTLLQYSFDRDFAHIHFVCQESNSKELISGNLSELFSKTLDTDILGAPYFFSDHRSGTKNVAVQDISNTLYLLSNSGKTLWTRKLKEAIVGEIHEVDILRNGKKQLAFSTESKLYVIDRNGNDVGSFPITFKDKITQPLAVFDYDNTRKYRFAIVQDKEILLYDSAGKIVTGFTFKKAASTIVLPPQHIRMGNKDYVLIAEENGTLNILSRTGKVRVPVSEKIDFSENAIEKEGNEFVVITKDNTKKAIRTNGNVSSNTLDVSNRYHFTTLGTTKVTLDDNLLRINGSLVELPFGIYTPPRLYSANRNTYITVTETQENKVYVYTKDGSLLPHFPVYGNSPALISSEKRNTVLLVKTGTKELAVYTF